MNEYTSLKRQKDFSDVYRQGIHKRNSYIVLFRKENGLPYNRCGVSVSKKVGNSVMRHRMIRMTREAFRHWDHHFDRNYDFVVSWKKYDSALKSGDVLEMIRKLYEKGSH